MALCSSARCSSVVEGSFEASDQTRHGRLAARRGVGARAHGDVFSSGCVGVGLGLRMRSGGRLVVGLEHAVNAAFARSGARRGRQRRRRDGLLGCEVFDESWAAFGHELCGYDRLGIRSVGALFLQILRSFLARAFHAPVGKAVHGGVDEAETRLRPDANCAEGERGGEIERDGDDGDADEIGADDVEVVNQRVGDDSAEQTFGWNHTHPANRPRQQSDEGGEKCDERDGADGLGVGRSDGPRAKPVERIHRQKRRQQEGCDAEELEQDVGDESADDADPVVSGPAGSRRGRGVERGIERRVGNQREDKEDREDEQQEADQLVEPAVRCWREWAREIHSDVRPRWRTLAGHTEFSRRKQTETSDTRSMTRAVPQDGRCGVTSKSADTPETNDYPKKVMWKQREWWLRGWRSRYSKDSCQWPVVSCQTQVWKTARPGAPEKLSPSGVIIPRSVPCSPAAGRRYRTGFGRR